MNVTNCKILVYLLLIFSFGVIACKEDLAFVENNFSKNLNIVKVTEKNLIQELNTFGTVSYSSKNDVTSQVQGTILDIYVKEGDKVAKGQLLAKLNNIQLDIQQEQAENSVTSAEAALFLAETNLLEGKLNVESQLISLEKKDIELKQKELELEKAKNNFEKNKELYDIGGISLEAYESEKLAITGMQSALDMLKKEKNALEIGYRDIDLIANGYSFALTEEERCTQLIDLNTRSFQAEVKSAKAALENAKKNLESVKGLKNELFIYSSCDGIVGAQYFEKGEFVPENEKIFTLLDISPVYGVFHIQEKDMGVVEKGKKIFIEIPSLSISMNTEIAEISPVADSQTGNFTVKAQIENNGLIIKPGMFLKCSLSSNEGEVFPVIPETALIQEEENNFSVFCVVKGILVKKSVKIIEKKDGFIWLETGVTVGDEIIDEPSPFLKEGQIVR